MSYACQDSVIIQSITVKKGSKALTSKLFMHI